MAQPHPCTPLTVDRARLLLGGSFGIERDRGLHYFLSLGFRAPCHRSLMHVRSAERTFSGFRVSRILFAERNSQRLLFHRSL